MLTTTIKSTINRSRSNFDVIFTYYNNNNKVINEVYIYTMMKETIHLLNIYSNFSIKFEIREKEICIVGREGP